MDWTDGSNLESWSSKSTFYSQGSLSYTTCVQLIFFFMGKWVEHQWQSRWRVITKIAEAMLGLLLPAGSGPCLSGQPTHQPTIHPLYTVQCATNIALCLLPNTLYIVQSTWKYLKVPLSTSKYLYLETPIQPESGVHTTPPGRIGK